MPANRATSADRRAARRVVWRERLLGAAAAVLGSPSETARHDWETGYPVLLYHRVYPDQVPRHDPFGVTRSDLAAQLSWLKDRFELVTVTELVERLTSAPVDEGISARALGSEERVEQPDQLAGSDPVPDLRTCGAAPSSVRTAAITFDDGYQCTYEEAWPVLREASVRATLFVDTARLDGPRPALMRDELLAMAGEGMEIGSHTVSHANLTTLAPAEVVRELEESRAELAALLGQEAIGLAAPYGRYDSATIAAARACGYVYMCTCRQHQTNLPRSDPFLVDRVEVNRGDDLGRMGKKLSGAYAGVYATWYRLGPATQFWLTD